ncbi:SLC22A4_5 [Acanthosepion pharaonis]|uniref:SLC22A4_5 n=1 Tax=Acanthosepion pharaonis TaxID=158019 RepID=A0A812ALF3_ACAPH|nr:SLC22A4_5 [Sepia pharaonis]
MTDLQFSKYTGSDESIAPVYDTCNIRLYNNSLNSSTLLQTMPCINGYEYDAPLDTSIITEWDLVCSKSGMGEITQSLFIAGQGIGALVFPSFADHYGRKPIHILSNFIMVISAGISAMAPSYWIFAPTRLLCGICQQACLISGTSLACEIFPANKRTLMSGLIAVNWGIGVTLLGVFGFLLKNYSWRVLAAVCASTASICIFEMWYIKESFRWLFAQGRLEEGKKIIAFAAKQNNVDFDAIWRKNVEYLEELKISFINIFNWLMISFTYFGIYMTSNFLAGDRFLNFFLTASMEVIAGVILLKTLTKFSRRNSIAGFQILAGISLISLAVLKGIGEKTQTMKILTITFTLFGMLGASGAFSGVWLYTPEIYPTNLRSAGTGLASASSRVSSMLAPLTRLMAGQVPWAPGTIFGTGCLMACALLFLLPETRDQQLPQTMEDLKILQSVKNSKVNDIEKTASTT